MRFIEFDRNLRLTLTPAGFMLLMWLLSEHDYALGCYQFYV